MERTQGDEPSTSPASPDKVRASQSPYRPAHPALQAIGGQDQADIPKSPLRRQSATMIAPALARPASALGIRPNDPPHPVWAQYGAPPPARPYYLA
jgi:hypothetical protein